MQMYMKTSASQSPLNSLIYWLYKHFDRIFTLIYIVAYKKWQFLGILRRRFTPSYNLISGVSFVRSEGLQQNKRAQLRKAFEKWFRLIRIARAFLPWLFGSCRWHFEKAGRVSKGGQPLWLNVLCNEVATERIELFLVA